MLSLAKSFFPSFHTLPTFHTSSFFPFPNLSPSGKMVAPRLGGFCCLIFHKRNINQDTSFRWDMIWYHIWYDEKKLPGFSLFEKCILYFGVPCTVLFLTCYRIRIHKDKQALSLWSRKANFRLRCDIERITTVGRLIVANYEVSLNASRPLSEEGGEEGESACLPLLPSSHWTSTGLVLVS